MNATVNGQLERLPERATVADVVTRLGHEPGGRGLAVALNGEVVARAQWTATQVTEGDRLEVLIATQGG
ncbi:MAG: sulfur carrier protein ThiS [Actinomycetota bacterium]|nr:sulfur carrier protein ThiS [Actinomycetota bacterium]